jgi:transcriptional regulator with XRE-family HTH domain
VPSTISQQRTGESKDPNQTSHEDNQDDLAARYTLLGFEIGRSTVSHIETGLRGVSDLEMVMLANALRVPVTELIPVKRPRWKTDIRPPTADKSK